MYYHLSTSHLVVFMLSPLLSGILSETLVFIHHFESRYHVTPSYSDFRAGMKIGQGTIQYRLRQLKAEGYTTALKGRNRSLCLTEKAVAALKTIGQYQESNSVIPFANSSIPFFGEIAAGYLSEPAMNEGSIELDIDPSTHFALIVSGDSMIEAGILDRSTVVLKRVPDGYEPKPGQIVAAYVEGAGTTLKRFYRDAHNAIVLEPANATYKAQTIKPGTFVKINGVLKHITIAD
jgi:repressor LexA